MNYADKMFMDDLEQYCPDKIEKAYKEYGLKIETGLIKKYIFLDYSYIEVYGGEVVSVNGNTGEEDDEDEE